MPIALIVLVLLLVVFVVLPVLGAAIGFVISTALVGLLIGALGRLVVPGNHRLGILTTVALGIAGSLAGGALASVLGVGGVATFLLQVAVAAAGVAVVSGTSGGRSLGGRRSRGLSR